MPAGCKERQTLTIADHSAPSAYCAQGWRGAAAALLLASAPAIGPACGAEPSGPCDKPILRAEGRISGWSYAPAYKQMLARRLSVHKWEQTAAELYGAGYARWALAKGRNIDCEDQRDQPWLKGRVSCVAAAIPCAMVSR